MRNGMLMLLIWKHWMTCTQFLPCWIPLQCWTMNEKNVSIISTTGSGLAGIFLTLISKGGRCNHPPLSKNR